ncbi:uncharacterized protein N7503_009371 [Penicillium pulvis]|uniref:uncharacterized protein n=1 Tax=Penicillium pulvis TaxID=1562058 RepID=UPI002546931C|nr:uncharacterized protein N7503_009371 [Penicillium pulvis]KAJ5793393.1 hypothetical protein N7503_009371 [Penicillium pulvis]
MKNFKPVFRLEFEGKAETHQVSDKAELDTTNPLPLGYAVRASPRLLDRWLDATVRWAGSAPVFLFIIAGLLTWAFMGIPYGDSDIWVAGISDVQAIMCYIFDSLLMRQLLREYTEHREAMLEIQSRLDSHERMTATVKTKFGPEGIRIAAEECNNRSLESLSQALHPQTLFARCIIRSAKVFGHIITVGLYWICIFVWLAFGKYCGWSSQWQLYINDATSALMALVFAFLTCLRERYGDYNNNCLDAIFRLDISLERELRHLTKDEMPHPPEVASPPKENFMQVGIFYYADIVGTLVGIIILVLVFIIWLAIGPVFKFNSTWWLLIGTYAGLVGLLDSFVLRNVQNKVHQYVGSQVRQIEKGDMGVLARLSLEVPSAGSDERLSLTQRVSHWMDAVSSHLLTVVAGFLLTIGCLVTSSALKWSLTGQLVSNVAPSIIETFFMLILITGQNDAEKKARVDLTNMYLRRQRLLAFMKDLRKREERKLSVDLADA